AGDAIRSGAGATPASASKTALQQLIVDGVFTPRIRQISGDTGWSGRLRIHDEGIVLHLMNRAIEATAHPIHKDAHNGGAVLQDFRSLCTDNRLVYEVELDGCGTADSWSSATVKSPELGSDVRQVQVEKLSA